MDLDRLAYTVSVELPPDEGWIEVSVDDETVARAHVARIARHTVIKFITVHEAYRQRGIASRLVEILKETSDVVIAKGCGTTPGGSAATWDSSRTERTTGATRRR